MISLHGGGTNPSKFKIKSSFPPSSNPSYTLSIPFSAPKPNTTPFPRNAVTSPDKSFQISASLFARKVGSALVIWAQRERQRGRSNGKKKREGWMMYGEGKKGVGEGEMN